MTENEAIQADQNADGIARVALCSQGAAECRRRQSQRGDQPDDLAPVFRRHAREYRQTGDGGVPTAKRLYVCRYCNTNHIFPLDNPG